MLRAMPHVVRDPRCDPIRVVDAPRPPARDACLRHQLAVLARSNRRFRPSDRLLWLILRRVWRGGALVMIQPATVDRWHRDRFVRRWWRRSRRPGRPRIDSPCRDLIGRLAKENRLWGAPRIHGELLKLGVVVSELTVSRYLRRRCVRSDISPNPRCQAMDFTPLTNARSEIGALRFNGSHLASTSFKITVTTA